MRPSLHRLLLRDPQYHHHRDVMTWRDHQDEGSRPALTDDVFHPEEIPSGVIRTIEVDLDVERLASTHNQLVALVLVRVVIHLVAVPSLLEQVNPRDMKVVYAQRKQWRETVVPSV